MKDKVIKHRGQMLIEIVIAVGIIALVLVGVSDLITRSSRLVNFQRQKDEAVSIIQKILNDYRSQRDADPQNFYDNAVGGIFDPCVSGKPYKCTVILDKAPGKVNIDVKAEWDDGGQTLNVDLSQTLTINAI